MISVRRRGEALAFCLSASASACSGPTLPQPDDDLGETLLLPPPLLFIVWWSHVWSETEAG